MEPMDNSPYSKIISAGLRNGVIPRAAPETCACPAYSFLHLRFHGDCEGLLGPHDAAFDGHVPSQNHRFLGNP